jgi:hypothetical protein
MKSGVLYHRWTLHKSYNSLNYLMRIAQTPLLILTMRSGDMPSYPQDHKQYLSCRGGAPIGQHSPDRDGSSHMPNGFIPIRGSLFPGAQFGSWPRLNMLMFPAHSVCSRPPATDEPMDPCFNPRPLESLEFLERKRVCQRMESHTGYPYIILNSKLAYAKPIRRMRRTGHLRRT